MDSFRVDILNIVRYNQFKINPYQRKDAYVREKCNFRNSLLSSDE